MDRAGARVNRPPAWLVAALAAVPTTALALFYLWPLGTLFTETLGADAVADTLRRATTREVLWFTFWQAVASTGATLVVGLIPAWLVARYEFRGRGSLLGAVTAVFVLPTVVVGGAVLAVLPASIERSTCAIIVAHVLFNIAVVVRLVGALWERLPTDLSAAAATLGAGPLDTMRHVTFPLLRPALLATASAVFVLTFTSFGVIRVVGAPGTRTIEVEVWRRATQLGDIPGASALTIVQLLVLGLVLAATGLLQRRWTTSLDLAPTHRRRPRTRRERSLVTAIGLTTAAVVIVPIAAMVIASFSSPTGWTTAGWTDLDGGEIRPGLRVGIDPVAAVTASLRFAAWATLFAVLIGGLASLAITAAQRAGRLLDIGLTLPIATSAVTIGLGLLITFDTPPVDWRAEWWLVPVGQALVAAPFVVRAIVPSLRAIDPQLRAAASTLGAAPSRAWREVVLPMAWRPLLAAAGLAGAISLGEFGATSMLSRSGNETLPIAIERLLGRTGATLQAQGYALASILALVTGLLMIIAERGTGRTGER